MASGGGEKILKTHEEWSEKFGKIDDRFANFYNERVLSDVTFIVGPDKEIVRGHKLVLIACSWEFFIALSLLKLDNEKLIIPDITCNTFMCFLEFCYRGKVDLDGKDVWGLLKLAHRFNVKQLIGICEDFLKKNLNANTCIEFYLKDTFLPDDSEIKMKIFEKIESEFATITDGSILKYFLDIPAQKLHNIAKSEYLTCNEMDVFRNLIKWAEHACKKVRLDCLPKNLRKILGKILYEIRFPIMKPEQILEIQANYPELLSLREISAIGKFMLKEKDHCHGFKFNSREGRDCYVHFFNGKLGYSDTFTDRLSISFKSEQPMKFVGFRFYDFHESRPIRIVEPHFCKLNKTLVNWTLTRFESVNSSYPSTLISFYCIRFQEKQDIIPQQWYELNCILDEDFPLRNYTSPTNPLESYDEFNKIHLKKGFNNCIPSLIFQN